MKILNFNLSHAIRTMSTLNVDVIEPSVSLGSMITIKVKQKYPGGAEYEDTLFVGRVRSYKPTRRIAEGCDVYQISCSPIPAIMAGLPIVTQKFTGLGSSIIGTILQTYSGMVGWHDASGPTDPLMTDVSFEENSVLSALERVAEIAGWIWYIANDGKIYFREYGYGAKTDFDPAYLSDEVGDESSELDQYSAVKVRGQFTAITETIGDLIPWAAYNCTVDNNDSAYAQYEYTFPISPEYDHDKMMQSVVITGDRDKVPMIAGIQIVGEVVSYNHPQLILKFTTGVGGGFGAAGTVPIYFRVIADMVPAAKRESIDMRGLGTGHNTISSKDALSQVFRLKSGSYAILDAQSVRLSNEASEQRVEITLTDSALTAQMGARWLEVDNVYASLAQCSVIANQVLMMSKSGGRRISLSGPYARVYNVNSLWRIPVMEQGRPKSPADWIDNCVLDRISISFSAQTHELKSNYEFVEKKSVV